ncbi:MAG: hypothetical protein WB987_14150 [Candidatus Acidiferrales bacterium]
MQKVQIERALRISGILLILGIAVEIISLVWEKPLAFLLFVGVGGFLTLAGIAFYLYSLVPTSAQVSPDIHRGDR